MTIGSTKEVRDVVRFAQKNGFVVRSSRGHIVMRHPDGLVSMSGTPSCPYGPTNAMRDILRILDKQKPYGK